MRIINQRNKSSGVENKKKEKQEDKDGIRKCLKKKGGKKISLGKQAVRGLLALLLAVSLLFYRDSFREILEGIRQVSAEKTGVSLLLVTAGYVLEGMTIFCMMGAVIPGASALDGIFIAFVCEFYRLTTLGNGSGVAEIHYLCKCGAGKNRTLNPIKAESNAGKIEEAKSGKQAADSTTRGMEPGSATVLTMIQYITKRIAIAVLGLLGFLVLYYGENTREICREYGAFVGIGCLITAGVIVVFLAVSLSDKVSDAAAWVMDWLSLKIPSCEDSFRKWKEQIGLLNQSGKRILKQKRRMMHAVLIQSGKLLLFYGIIAYLFKGKVSLGAVGCLSLMALAYMLSGVIPAPSGAGALEFVFLLFFTRFADTGEAVAAILMFRFVTWIFPAIVGGVFLAVKGMRENF